jgi:hypothetical protein
MTDIEKTENEITELRVKRDDVIARAAATPRPVPDDNARARRRDAGDIPRRLK